MTKITAIIGLIMCMGCSRLPDRHEHHPSESDLTGEWVENGGYGGYTYNLRQVGNSISGSGFAWTDTSTQSLPIAVTGERTSNIVFLTITCPSKGYAETNRYTIMRTAIGSYLYMGRERPNHPDKPLPVFPKEVLTAIEARFTNGPATTTNVQK